MTVSQSKAPALPDFLLIGVAKAGTSWIFEILHEHPEVFVPVAKDIMFFNRFYDKGLEWYSSFFAGKKDKKVAGELSHDYYLSAETARRIRETIPHVKLICCLRETIDKLISAYIYNISTGHANMSFEDYINYGERARAAKPDFDEYVHVSLARQVEYYENLKPYYDLFPRRQILVLFFEDLKKDPAAFARKIYQFLGVDADFRPSVLNEKVNVAHEARIEWVAHLVYRVAQAMRLLGLANVVGAVKRNKFFERLLYKPQAQKVEVPRAALEQVRARYRKDYDKLAQLIGQPLPPEWY